MHLLAERLLRQRAQCSKHILQRDPRQTNAAFVRGGIVQEVASDTADVLINLLDGDSIEEGDTPDDWRPPDTVISDPQTFDTYTRGADAL
jgi:hypothetical protein